MDVSDDPFKTCHLHCVHGPEHGLRRTLESRPSLSLLCIGPLQQDLPSSQEWSLLMAHLLCMLEWCLPVSSDRCSDGLEDIGEMPYHSIVWCLYPFTYLPPSVSELDFEECSEFSFIAFKTKTKP